LGHSWGPDGNRRYGEQGNVGNREFTRGLGGKIKRRKSQESEEYRRRKSKLDISGIWGTHGDQMEIEDMESREMLGIERLQEVWGER
jgi:hypothetical protein